MNTRRALKQRLTTKLASLYPDPQQTRLENILGATTVTCGRFRRNGKPLTITLSRGRLLRSERFRRSVVDDMGVLANDIRMAIQVEGPEYERQVVAMYERDEKLREQGWVVRYIPQRWLWENPAKVRQAVKQFVYS
jgi:very-short-patch-repair endonuclease